MRIKPGIALLLTIFLFAGCTIMRAREFESGKITQLSKDEAVIFGKIVFIENGAEVAPYGSQKETSFSLYYVEAEKRTLALSLKPDGTFSFVVPRGTYILPQVNFGYLIQPQVAFQLPDGAGAFYIGTLVVDAETGINSKGYLFLRKIKGTKVIDGYDAAREDFIRQNPGFTLGVEKRLMVYGRSIPATPHLLERETLERALKEIGIGPLSR